MKKDEIRRRVKAAKSLISDDDRRQAAEQVFQMLEHTAAFMLSDHILLYHSLPDELSTREFIDKWHTTKHFYLPRVNGVNLEVLPYNQSRLHLGAFNIEEPEGDEVVDVASIEMVVVPAVAYDRRGNRVGRGRGYYDRLLATLDACMVGVGYDFQLVDQVDAEPHDIPVDYVITPAGIFRCK